MQYKLVTSIGHMKIHVNPDTRLYSYADVKTPAWESFRKIEVCR